LATLDEIKARLDIVDLVSQYVPLQKSGASFKALCPFHNERTPSFHVFPNRQTWRCFGACATGGDAFTFVMRKENLDFPQTLKLLADRVGVALPTRKAASHDDALVKINEAAARYFAQHLKSSAGAKALDYLKGRGLTSKTIDDFQLGLSPGDGQALKRHLVSLGYREEQLVMAGLMAQANDGGHQDLFRRRLIFPIWNAEGQLAGFGGRSMDDSPPKYLNSRQGPLFDKGRILFAYHLALPSIRQKGQAVVVEGYMDAIVAHQEGFTNVVASMGTSLTRHQAVMLEGVAKEVVLALDPDAAGQEATLRSLESSWQVLQRRPMVQSRSATLYERPHGPTLKVAPLPDGIDPDEIVLKSHDEWSGIINGALTLWDFLKAYLPKRFDLSTPDGKDQVAKMLMNVVHETTNAFDQDRYLGELAGLLGVSSSLLVSHYGQPKAAPTRRNTPKPASNGAAPFEKLNQDPLEEHCLALLLQVPKLEPAASSLRSEHFTRPENREVFSHWLKGTPQEMLDQDIAAHYLRLAGKALPPANFKEKEAAFQHCARRMEERRLRRLKEEEALRLADMDPGDILQHKDEILRVNQDIEALFKTRSG
jgi:DNA primase